MPDPVAVEPDSQVGGAEPPTVFPERRNSSARNSDILFAQQTPHKGITRLVVFRIPYGQSTVHEKMMKNTTCKTEQRKELKRWKIDGKRKKKREKLIEVKMKRETNEKLLIRYFTRFKAV